MPGVEEDGAILGREPLGQIHKLVLGHSPALPQSLRVDSESGKGYVLLTRDATVTLEVHKLLLRVRFYIIRNARI